MNDNASQVAVFPDHQHAADAAQRQKPGWQYRIFDLSDLLHTAKSLIPTNGGLSHSEITDIVRKVSQL